MITVNSKLVSNKHAVILLYSSNVSSEKTVIEELKNKYNTYHVCTPTQRFHNDTLKELWPSIKKFHSKVLFPHVATII